MSAHLSTLESLFDLALFAKRRGGKAPDIKIYNARFKRIVSPKAVQTTVKITGSSKTAAKSRAHMAYVVRGAYRGEDENGNIIETQKEARELGGEWELHHGKDHWNKTINITLSMPHGTDKKSVLEAARAWAKVELANHRYLMVLHQEKPSAEREFPNPHVHFVVKAQGKDFKFLSRSPDDLHRWRERFAYEMRMRGVEEAEATPRKSRGLFGKADKSAVHRYAKQEPNKSWVLHSRKDHKPSAQEIEEQREIRNAYAGLAQVYRQAGHTEVADQAIRFLASMPELPKEKGVDKGRTR
jgi:hypothetical protein